MFGAGLGKQLLARAKPVANVDELRFLALDCPYVLPTTGSKHRCMSHDPVEI